MASISLVRNVAPRLTAPTAILAHIRRTPFWRILQGEARFGANVVGGGKPGTMTSAPDCEIRRWNWPRSAMSLPRGGQSRLVGQMGERSF